MDASTASIRTPDQRIRVFVSSTLRELESERRAAREAIEALHLAPVMFEMGARPHPPRSLYRSYLAQSDIFLGIYGDQYGWVAPDETVSGLEDEYRLSAGMPRLVYLRTSTGAREPRLKELLDRIRSDDTTSYRSFQTPGELQQLVVEDLAVLLAERFDASRRSAPRSIETPSPSIPAPFGPLIGRETELRAVLALLDDRAARIVTILGPGGVGKSRLAIEVAEAVAATGREVAFAMLENLTTADQVVPAIARVLGVRDSGSEPLEDTVIAALADRDTVIVIDNLEHVIAASASLVRLVVEAPRVQLLVTSRSPLRVRAERIFELDPLSVPPAEAGRDDAAGTSGVDFFVRRAQSVRPGFTLTAQNTDDVAAIVRAVDGLPLAIELAAARARTMTPREILARLDSALLLLVGGARDLPPRQQALRSTIEWSVRLLEPDAAAAFDAVAVFRGPFTLEAAEAVLLDGAAAADALEALVDASLLHRYERGGVLVFATLALVHAYSLERSAPDAATVERWVAYYVAMGAAAQAQLRGAGQVALLARLDAEAENLAAVMRHLLDAHRLATAAEFAWSMYMPLWISGRLGLQRAWMTELIDIAARERVELDPRTEAIALYYTRAVSFWRDPDVDVVPGLRRSAELFAADGDFVGAGLAGLSLGLAHLAHAPMPDLAQARNELEVSLVHFHRGQDAWGEAMAQVTLGRLDMAMGDLDSAGRRFDESVRETASEGELLGMAIAQHHRGWPRFLGGDLDGAEADFGEALDISLRLQHDEGVVYGLDGLTGVAAARGQPHRAGLLIGAVRRLRRRTGIVNEAAFLPYAAALQELRAAGGGAEIDAAARDGENLPLTEVLSRARA